MPTEQRRPGAPIVNDLHERPANRSFNKGTTETAPEKAVAASPLSLFGLIPKTASKHQASPSDGLLTACAP